MQPDEVNTASPVTPPVDSPVEATTPALEPKTEATAETPKEPDYKAMWEEESRRRAGLDRKLQRLSKGNNSREDLMTGDEEVDSQVMGHPFVQKALNMLAETQLKEGVRELLKDYPQLPDGVKKAIEKNPKGWVSNEAQNVNDGLEDIEAFLLENYGVSAAGTETPQTKQFPATQTNASVAGQEREKSLAEMSAEELNDLAEAGKVTTQDLEQLAKKQAQQKEVKHIK